MAMDLREFLRATALIGANRRLTRAEFESRRLERFRSFAAYVGQKSLYYGRIMRERGIRAETCTPEQFPALTKTELMANFDEVATEKEITRAGVAEFLRHSPGPQQLYRDRYRIIHTSGTSGEVGYFVYDQKAWARGVAQMANAPSTGFAPRRKRVAFIGAADGHYAGVSLASTGQEMPLSLLYKTILLEVNAPLANNVAALNEFQPDIVITYGSMVALLAECQLEGTLRIRPRMVNCSGEGVPVYAREVTEKAFPGALRNLYSCSEHLFMAEKNPGAGNMRLIEDDLIFEFFSDHVLVTNLFNRTLPLIRYRMNDVLTPVDSREHSPYLSVAELMGRVEQAAKFVNRHGMKDHINPITIVELFIPHVRRFQLQITGDSACTLAMVVEPGTDEAGIAQAIAAARARMDEIFRVKDMQNVEYDVVPVTELRSDPKSGKFKTVLYVAVSGRS